MKKEEYIKEINKLQDIITNATNAITIIREKYISENREFQDGEKVIIYTPPRTYPNRSTKEKIQYPSKKRFAFIQDAYMSKSVQSDNGDIKYNLKKCKKNGEISAVSDSYYGEEIRKINPKD